MLYYNKCLYSITFSFLKLNFKIANSMSHFNRLHYHNEKKYILFFSTIKLHSNYNKLMRKGIFLLKYICDINSFF